MSLSRPPIRRATEKRAAAPRFAIRWRLATAALLVALLLAGLALHRLPVWVGLAYLALGVGSAITYWIDKRAAIRREWRIPEARLHGLDLIGGIGGGLLAQASLHHKTSKTEFGVVSALIAGLHLLGLAAIVVGFVSLPGV